MQIVASDGAHLSIMRGELGICIKGSHPDLGSTFDDSQLTGYQVKIASNPYCIASLRDPTHSELAQLHTADKRPQKNERPPKKGAPSKTKEDLNGTRCNLRGDVFIGLLLHVCFLLLYSRHPFNGDVSGWGWITSESNLADWDTKPKQTPDLILGSPWWDGPSFLYKEFEQRDAVFSPTVKEEEMLPEEEKTLERCSELPGVVGDWARVMQAVKMKTFKGAASRYANPKAYQEAGKFLVIEAQKKFHDSKEVYKRFKTLLPSKRDGLWVVGLRLEQNNPLYPDNGPQILLPPEHPLTLMLREEGHMKGHHRGRDATLSLFRRRFHTSYGTRLSKKVGQQCFLCKLLKQENLSQIMGQPPAERLRPAPPFTYTIVYLFGPSNVPRKVQKCFNYRMAQGYVLGPRKQLKAASKDINGAFDTINEA